MSSLTSTVPGCSMAKAIDRATASGGWAIDRYRARRSRGGHAAGKSDLRIVAWTPLTTSTTWEIRKSVAAER